MHHFGVGTAHELFSIKTGDRQITAVTGSMHKILINSVKDAWSTTSFAADDVAFFAQKLTVDEARNGLMGLSFVLLCLFATEGLLFTYSGLGAKASTTCLLLAGLALHIMVSARAIRDVKSLYMLGATLLMISGTAFVLLAHNTGAFSFALFASVTLLFMVVPLVPWGLKEAMLVLVMIYGTFTFSTWGSNQHFDTQTLWSLQFIMLGAGAVSLAMVMRNTCLRKADIRNRFELEQANHRMMHLSNRDPLTSAWNRRFLNQVFNEKTAEWSAAGETWHFAFLDLDDFKLMNDNCGHDYGDRVLRGINEGFSELIGDNGYVIRMGGDEFSLLFVAEDPEALLAEGVERVRASVRSPENKCTTHVQMCFGLVSVLAGVPYSQEQAYRSADVALYKAKERKQYFDGKTNIIRTFVKTAV